VRRRVYDALNVLYAAGVLMKDDKKHVFCNPKAKEILENASHSSATNSHNNNSTSLERSASKQHQDMMMTNNPSGNCH
jgi:hypothetical protein